MARYKQSCNLITSGESRDTSALRYVMAQNANQKQQINWRRKKQKAWEVEQVQMSLIPSVQQWTQRSSFPQCNENGDINGHEILRAAGLNPYPVPKTEPKA